MKDRDRAYKDATEMHSQRAELEDGLVEAGVSLSQ